MTFDLTGRRLLRVRLDTILYLDLDDDWFIAIENDYEFVTADGRTLRTESDEEPTIVELLSTAVGTALSSFSYTDDGHLHLGLAGGELHVGPSASYESWNFVGPHKERVVALSGGRMAIWS